MAIPAESISKRSLCRLLAQTQEHPQVKNALQREGPCDGMRRLVAKWPPCLPLQVLHPWRVTEGLRAHAPTIVFVVLLQRVYEALRQLAPVQAAVEVVDDVVAVVVGAGVVGAGQAVVGAPGKTWHRIRRIVQGGAGLLVRQDLGAVPYMHARLTQVRPMPPQHHELK